ncbi:MAG: helix-turn-helix domain-containing protein [Firmicutes bacterium]|nr:helix-turn-helix domain-containing protein [Bacillota bacterium]
MASLRQKKLDSKKGAAFVMQYPEDKVIAARIKHERKAMGLTQEKLAELLNADRNTVGAWEGKTKQSRSPELKVMLKMCELFDCEIDYLLGAIDYKTREVTDIQKVTGLTPAAIKILEETKEPRTDPKRWTHTGAERQNFDIISLFIEHEQLWQKVAGTVKYLIDYELPDMSKPGNTLTSDMLLVEPGLYYEIQWKFTEFIKTLVDGMKKLSNGNEGERRNNHANQK